MNFDNLNLVYIFLDFLDLNNCKLVSKYWYNSIYQKNYYSYKNLIINKIKSFFPLDNSKKFKLNNNILTPNYYYFLRRLPAELKECYFLDNDEHIVSIKNNKICFHGSFTGSDRIIFLDYHIPRIYWESPFIFPVLRNNIYNFYLSNIYYFEIKVDSINFRESWQDECIGIGFCNRKYNLSSLGYQVGWIKGSFGYHSDDGGIFIESENDLAQRKEKWGPGDTIGAGIKYNQNTFEVFFTKNGKFLGFINKKLIGKNKKYLLTPAISVDSSYGIEVNFGQKEFKFPIENMILDYFKKPKKLKIFEADIENVNNYQIFEEITANSISQLLLNSFMNFISNNN